MLASSLIIKNESGIIKGYAIMEKDRFLVMVKGGGESGRLVLRSNDGKEEEYAVMCDGREKTIPNYGEMPSCAYVVTDEAAKETEEEKKPASEEKSIAACKKHPSDCVYKKEGQTSLVLKGAYRMNRWPPPPCWPTACYVDGVWCEREPDCI